MNRSILGIFFLAGTVLLGCKKVEGEGGSSTIHGVVVEKKMNSVGGVIASYPIGDQDVFIIYGADDTFYDDKIKYSMTKEAHPFKSFFIVDVEIETVNDRPVLYKIKKLHSIEDINDETSSQQVSDNLISSQNSFE